MPSAFIALLGGRGAIFGRDPARDASAAIRGRIGAHVVRAFVHDKGTADRENLVACLRGPWATYSRIGGGPVPRAIVEGPAAAGPCPDGGRGHALWARECKTSMAQPRFNRSPSQPAHAVRALTRRPCES